MPFQIPVTMMLLLVSCVLVIGCGDGDHAPGGDTTPAGEVAPDDVTGVVDVAEVAPVEATVPNQDVASDTPYDTATPSLTHEIVTYTIDEAMTGIASGDFGTPAVEYAPIAVDPGLVHVLTFQVTPMMPPLMSSVPSHGPVVLYDDDLRTVVVSPMDHFFAALLWVEGGEVHVGLNGDIDEVPAGFTQRFLVVEGQGIAATVQEWGRLLLEDRGAAKQDRYADAGLSYLGYWTDNGAAYYYETAPGMNEAETLLAVEAEADTLGIPYGYFQLDSWWYLNETATR